MRWDRDLQGPGRAVPVARDLPGHSPVRCAGRFGVEFKNSMHGSVEKACGCGTWRYSFVVNRVVLA